ncbi:hypothetical protein [Sphingobium yanoikuyae]|uniref:hypothetical protein n=1 Tax=Sphingobium yanoikuyae TaxID=13690 RepID=UPI0013765012|nr:hypothetical protein [Sphingobium yanoikuyae]NBB37671.1 hypothetical protein [Sphingobium yanoikuyae]
MTTDPIIEGILGGVEAAIAKWRDAGGVGRSAIASRVFSADGAPRLRIHVGGRVWLVRVEETEL